MDMSGIKDMLPGSAARADRKALAIEAFHDHCFIQADSPSPEDVADSIQAHFDHPDQRAAGILREAAFTVQDVDDYAATVEEGSEKHARLVRLHEASLLEEQAEYASYTNDENSPV